MFSKLHERLGTAGLVVAIVALVAALAGTAVASISGSEKKEIKKFAKKYSQQFAKDGPAGPAGAAGSAGPPGPAGPQGPKGDAGSQGKAGEDGKSVAVNPIPGGAAGCESLGGVEVEVEGSGSPSEVCNGEPGPPGPEGSPWTDGGTLPQNATESGTWSVTATAAGTPSLFGAFHPQFVPISFTIPLAPETSPAAHFVDQEEWENEEDPAECTVGGEEGTFLNPLAQSGNLCIYVGSDVTENLALSGLPLSTTSVGAFMAFEVTEDTIGTGSWAVTG